MLQSLLDLRHTARVLNKNVNASAVAVFTSTRATVATVTKDFFTVLSIIPSMAAA